jgi:acetyltransferase-like isoleucine patch superfamily enzyme
MAISPKLRSYARRKYAALRGGAELSSHFVAGRLPIHASRVLSLRIWGAQIHKTACIYHGMQVRGARNLKVGERTNIGEGSILDARGGLTIGNNVNLSSQVHIWTAQHDWTDPHFSYVESKVVIEDHVWIGPRVTVLPGAHIKYGAVVAAGAVVRGTVGPKTLVGGVPARVIGQRATNLEYELGTRRDKPWWW